MLCKYAYTIHGEKQMLCKLEGAPNLADKTSKYHALCPYQRFCSTSQTYIHTEFATDCMKLRRIDTETAQNDTQCEKEEVITKSTRKRKTAQNAE